MFESKLTLEEIGEKQLNLIEKSKIFISEGNEKKRNLVEDPNFFLTCWSETIGNLKLKEFLNEKINFFFKMKIFLKEFYLQVKISKVEVIENLNPSIKFKNLVITYCLEGDIDLNGNYYDRYFSMTSSKNTNTLCVLILVDDKVKVPKKIDSNLFILKRNYQSYPASIILMLKLILIFLWKSKIFFFRREFFNMTSKSYFDNIMNKEILDLISKNQIQQVLMPYEGHPQQHRVFNSVKQLSKKIKTIGYMHSVLPCLPTDYIRREGFPDKILVNGQDQKKILNNFLGWDNSQVEAITSLRYTEQNKKNFQQQIFFPYYIKNEKKIFNYFKDLVLNSKPGNLPHLKVRNHPAMKHSKKHLNLKYLMERFLEKNKNKFSNNELSQNVSIFIGSTASVIEALERGIDTIHICENVIFDLYHTRLWENVLVKKISTNVFVYKLKKFGECIKIGKTNISFDSLRF